MRKKKVIVLLLGVIMIIGIATSFAYFINKTNNITDSEGETLQKIQITNGKVEVTAQATNDGTVAHDWSYDVVRKSNAALPTDATELKEYERKNANPDITGVAKTTYDGDTSGLERATIGAPFTDNNIQYTRPGDAIVLGTTNEAGQTGLLITNNSNITIKAQLNVANNEAATTEVTKLKNAGWKLYVNDAEVNMENLASGAQVDLTTLASSKSQLVSVRLELPLTTKNSYEKSVDGTATTVDYQGGTVTDLNISNLFEIRATQENNPGWNEDGTGDDGTGSIKNPIQP
ncbi:hypothetical protein CM240_0133 [Clostridium bornimense]|uniref:Uncharacterized protein n=1 Tax=Clostridium bornimense TaxID=1216932 RepID=W6RZ44_9CLOT|nr:hypothetical protein [Clostridium bornimense]CDM67312.1 hypothetical protein CM240_0133 [Clostridium bornimense]